MTKNRQKAHRVAALSCLVAVLLSGTCGRASRPSSHAPNEEAAITVIDGTVRIEYNGRQVFCGKITSGGERFDAAVNTYRVNDKISQAVLFTCRDGRLRLSGAVTGSPESFACEADRREKGLAVVRHASGLSRSLLNRAVYDRREDWLVSVDAGPRAAVEPLRADAGSRTFTIDTEGREIVLRFRPAFYRVHRGLRFFKPWTYAVWPRSVTGWISWFAFFDKVTENDIVRTADVLSDVLLPYGYEYLQIDDGYQKGEGLPDLWLNTNAKFPRGLAFLTQYIKSKGLKPGLWTNAAFKQADFADSHPDWFVTEPSGRPARGNWVEFSLDASDPQALEALVKPVYRGLRDMGWDYFKVDALRHLRYEGYNAHADYFRRKNADLTETFRRYVETVRNEIGRDVYLLGCWGVRPELIGLIDGCRIGTDGFSYAGLAQFNSWNNVVWRNDPDHIELNADRYRSTLVSSLTGSVLLLTDKPELYKTEAAEPAKRAAPVLWTVPGQVFDVDPSRSDALARVDTEVSGSGPRVFDAGLESTCDLFLLEIDRPFEHWAVLGRTGQRASNIGFADLGLDPDREYFVFEFWSKQLLGCFKGGFSPGRLDPVFRSQDFVIRERASHPQILATSRHVTGGGIDLLDVRWKDDVLSGKSRVTAADPYVVYFTVPEGYKPASIESEGARVLATRRDGLVVAVTLLADRSRDITWTVRFAR